jgi:hypothetical protein
VDSDNNYYTAINISMKNREQKMAIIKRVDFIRKYKNIELDLNDANIVKQLKKTGFNNADIQALALKDGHRLVKVRGRFKEVSNAYRNGMISAEEAYLYFEEKDKNGTWVSIDPDDPDNPNQMALDKRIRMLDSIFQAQLDAGSISTPPPSRPDMHSDKINFTEQIPTLADLTLQQANQFFDQYPKARYHRDLPISNYDMRISAMIGAFHDTSLKNPRDLVSKLIKIGDKWETVLTHVRKESDIRLLAYRNSWKSKQRDLLRYIQPGEWYLGTSHHNPGHRHITRQVMQDSDTGLDLLKFNITHVRNYIGVQDARGKAGVVAIDSPRSYATANGAGYANNKDYPFLLWRVRFLDDVSHAEQRAYINNIRSWSMLFNKVTKFPPDYNGNDNLMTHNMDKVVEFGSHVLNALTGNRSDLNKLHSKSEQVYCSESGMHLALNLGLNIPLNKANIEVNFSKTTWSSVKVMLNEGKNFWKNGRHQDYYGSGSDGYVQYSKQNRQVLMEQAPDWLQPLKDKLMHRKLTAGGLAFRPWNTADMIEYFIHTAVPRKGRETWDVANTQAELLTWAKPGIFQSMGFSHSNPPPRELVMLFDILISKIRTNYSSYQAFREAIAPELLAANQIVAPKAMGEGAFIPPHMVISIKGDRDEMIGLEAVGQCFHEDFLRRHSF